MAGPSHLLYLYLNDNSEADNLYSKVVISTEVLIMYIWLSYQGMTTKNKMKVDSRNC
jgi:hypothetical protein